jgi:YD repeat-containing protein
MAYDDLGRKTEVTRPNGTRTTYAYDDRTGWLAEIRHLRGTAENQLTLSYHRDASGVIEWIREVSGDGASATTTQWDYGYDGLKRLGTATQRDLATSAVLRSYAY